jgi:hypothetical protein
MPIGIHNGVNYFVVDAVAPESIIPTGFDRLSPSNCRCSEGQDPNRDETPEIVQTRPSQGPLPTKPTSIRIHSIEYLFSTLYRADAHSLREAVRHRRIKLPDGSACPKTGSQQRGIRFANHHLFNDSILFDHLEPV